MAPTNKELHYLYNKKVCIAFYPDSHRYKREGYNQYEIGVTSVTGQLDKPGLIYWATGLARDYLTGVLTSKGILTLDDINYGCSVFKEAKKHAADIGTEVHSWIERWTKGENPTIPAEPYDEWSEEDVSKIVNGITAFLEWVKDRKVQIVHAEKMVYSLKYEFVGTLDAVALVDGSECIIDYKTSKGIYTEMRYQTVAYKKAYEEETGKKVRGGRWIIRLGKEDADFQAVFLPADDDEADYAAFLALLTLKKRSKQLAAWEKAVQNH